MKSSFMGRTAVESVLNIIADRWMLLLLRELFLGSSTWSDFSEYLAISPATLNKRLKLLVEAGCLDKLSLPGRRETAYTLTEAGRDLFPLMLAAREWQRTWDPRSGQFSSPWIHSCGEPLRCHARCASCDEPIRMEDVVFDRREGGAAPVGTRRKFRTSRAEALDKRSPGVGVSKIVAILGDRSATQLLAALWRGLEKFDEIEQWSQLHPAVLTERLRKLQLMGLCCTRLYQERPDRYLYTMTPVAMDLASVTLLMQNWGEKWLYPDGDAPGRVLHKTCGKPLLVQMKCNHCKQPVTYSDVRVGPL